jgi:hypothetical protein
VLLVYGCARDVHDASFSILSSFRGNPGNCDDACSLLDEFPEVDGRIHTCLNRVDIWLLARTLGSEWLSHTSTANQSWSCVVAGSSSGSGGSSGSSYSSWGNNGSSGSRSGSAG